MYYQIVSLSVKEPLEKLPFYLYFDFSGMIDAHTQIAVSLLRLTGMQMVWGLFKSGFSVQSESRVNGTAAKSVGSCGLFVGLSLIKEAFA